MHMAVGDYDPAEIRHMLRTSGKGDHYGRLAVPQTQSPPTTATSSELAAGIAALHD